MMRKTLCTAGAVLCAGAAQAHATSTSSCGPFRLAIPQDAQISPATGQNPVVVAVTHRGSKVCVLKGHPTLTLLDARDRPLPFRISHRRDQMVTHIRAFAVRLQPGRSAYFVLNKYRCDLGSTATARKLRVNLPGGRTKFSLRLPRHPVLGYCRGKGSMNTVTVSPLALTPRG